MIENDVGFIGLVGCILLDIYLVWKLWHDINKEKKLSYNTIEYEEACIQNEKRKEDWKSGI